VLFVWVRSFSMMLPYVKFAEDKVLVFVILREKEIRVVLSNDTLLSNESGSVKERIQATMPRPDSRLVTAHFVCP